MVSILGRVGRGGQNIRSDVAIVQELLNAHLPDGVQPLVVDGLIGPKTIAALSTFQRLNLPFMAAGPSGWIVAGDRTWEKLVQAPGPIPVANRALAVAAPPSAAPWPAKFTFEQFWTFTEPLEGGIAANCMFMVKDLQVATCMGITFHGKAQRAAGIAMAKKLQWNNKNTGHLASDAEIEHDYDVVLKMEAVAKKGSGFIDSDWKPATTCRITLDSIKTAVRNRAVDNMNAIRRQTGDLSVGDFDAMPADAQLCVLSLTWAGGNEFRFPTFRKLCRATDWFGASNEVSFKDAEGTQIDRQKHQRTMMINAGCAKAGMADPNVLQWPKALKRPETPKPIRQDYRGMPEVELVNDYSSGAAAEGVVDPGTGDDIFGGVDLRM